MFRGRLGFSTFLRPSPRLKPTPGRSIATWQHCFASLLRDVDGGLCWHWTSLVASLDRGKQTRCEYVGRSFYGRCRWTQSGREPLPVRLPRWRRRTVVGGAIYISSTLKALYFLFSLESPPPDRVTSLFHVFFPWFSHDCARFPLHLRWSDHRTFWKRELA